MPSSSLRISSRDPLSGGIALTRLLSVEVGVTSGRVRRIKSIQRGGAHLVHNFGQSMIFAAGVRNQQQHVLGIMKTIFQLHIVIELDTY